MYESDRIKRLQRRVIYASYLIEKYAISKGGINKLNITSGELTENIVTGPTSFTPMELDSILINTKVVSETIVPVELIVPVLQNVLGEVINLSGSFTLGGTGTLTWEPPANDGGSPIIYYTLNGEDIGLPIEPITHSISEIARGPHTYTIRAVTSIETGPPSTITISYIVFPQPPDTKPTLAPVEVGNTQIRVTWPTPYDGGSPITSFTIKVDDAVNPIEYNVSGTERTKLITGLTNGTAYQISIKSTNILGSSDYQYFFDTDFLNTYFTPIGVPFPPSNISRVLSENGITVSWTAPVPGDSAITNYNVHFISSGGEISIYTGDTATGDNSTSKEVIGLIKGETYTFKIYAMNTEGRSLYSLPTLPILYPTTKPDVINEFGAVYDEANTQLIVYWAAPNNGGSEITSYTVTSNRNNVITTDGITYNVYLPSLTSGLSYTFTIIATNAIGNSDPSAPTDSITFP